MGKAARDALEVGKNPVAPLLAQMRKGVAEKGTVIHGINASPRPAIAELLSSFGTNFRKDPGHLSRVLCAYARCHIDADQNSFRNLGLIKILPGNPPDVAAGSHVFGAGTGLPAAAKAPHSLNDWIEEFNCRGQKSTARADGRTSDAKASAKAITMAASSSAIGSTVA